jgi:hypothetical protein
VIPHKACTRPLTADISSRRFADTRPRPHQETGRLLRTVPGARYLRLGAVREIEPEALARLIGWRITLKELALLEARMQSCRDGGRREAEAARPGEESKLKETPPEGSAPVPVGRLHSVRVRAKSRHMTRLTTHPKAVISRTKI